MRRMLIPGAVALALVATLGVHEASAQKGKDKRNSGNPLRVTLTAFNVTTGQEDKNIMASAGDEVAIRLRVENRTGEAQNAVVHVVGGIPGCMIDQTVVEFFELGQKKEAIVTGIVPADQSGLLTVDVDVFMPKTADTKATNGSVAFNSSLKGTAPANGGMMHRFLVQAMVRSLVNLQSKPDVSLSISELKDLYRD